MLTRVLAAEYVRAMSAGRTRPCLVACEGPAGERVELVVKFSAGCDEGVTSLAREAIAACLAGDLGLPIPEPFLFEVAPDWVKLIADREVRAMIEASASVAFGSRLITGQYSAWNRGDRIPDALLPAAAAVFVFDAIVQNADRRAANPNCVVKGNEIRIFDHEMAFTHDLVIGWQPPWVPGSLMSLERAGSHIFRERLRGRQIELGPIRDAWLALSRQRLAAYGQKLPAEWAAARGAVDRALALIRDARNHIDGCLAEVQRILG